MPFSPAPFGMEAVGTIVAASTNLAVRQFLIDPTNATLMYRGDVARLLSSGFIDKDPGTATATPMGVFSGFEFTSSLTKQRLQSNYYPGAAAVITTDPIYASVSDDPNTIYVAQMAGAVTTFAGAMALLGANAPLIQTAGTPQYGRSRNALGTAVPTATLPIRIIDFLKTPDNPLPPTVADGRNYYMNVLVKFNNHAYTTLLGI